MNLEPSNPEVGSTVTIIDIDAFMERVGQDLPLAKELAGLFVTETPRLLAAVTKAIADKDCAALQYAAHAIKGSAANFSAERAVESAAVLERMGSAQDLTAAEEACIRLRDEVRRLSIELVQIKETNTV